MLLCGQLPCRSTWRSCETIVHWYFPLGKTSEARVSQVVQDFAHPQQERTPQFVRQANCNEHTATPNKFETDPHLLFFSATSIWLSLQLINRLHVQQPAQKAQTSETNPAHALTVTYLPWGQQMQHAFLLQKSNLQH